jgi:hypothetical protein
VSRSSDFWQGGLRGGNFGFGFGKIVPVIMIFHPADNGLGQHASGITWDNVSQFPRDATNAPRFGDVCPS